MTAVLSISVLSACGSGGQGVNSSGSGTETAHKEVLNVAIKGEPASLDPHMNTQLVSEAIRQEIFDFLVIKDENGDIQPSVAEKWEQIDDTTIRFYLRDDVVFHNGDPLTAEDVKFTLTRAGEKPGSSPLFGGVDGENSVVVDEYTIDVKMKEPMASIFNYLSAPEGALLPRRVLEEVGDDEFARHPIGSGPMKMKDWTTGTSIELERNDEYWGNKPTYKNLLFKFISEPANRTIELETGGVDIIYDVASNDIKRIEENEKLKIVSGTGLKYTYITLNMRDPVFEDARIREAIACALDIEAIVNNVYKGTASVADSVMSSNIFGYESQGEITYDPERAKTLLAEAGVADNLNITVMCSDDKVNVDILEIARNQWEAVGITADIQVMEYATFSEEEAAGRVQVGLSSFTASTGDPDQALGIWDSEYGGQLQGNDPYIDECLDTGRTIYDTEARAAHYAELQEYMWNTHYMIPLAYSDVVFATTDKVEGLQAHPGNDPYLANVVVYK